MIANDLRYPALTFLANGAMNVIASSDQLTLNSRRGLRKGFYSGLRIVDMNGTWFTVRSARKLHGLSGYTLLLNQWIRVELDLENTHRQADVEEVRQLVLKDFAAWDGWSSREDFDVLVRRVESAPTLPALIQILGSMVK